jgi:hypothetical protein
MIAEIPLLEVGRMASADLCRHDPERARLLVSAALSRRSHVLLPLVTRLLDRISLAWLLRQADPYLEEIRHVASFLDAPGAYFLNTVYEWACSTSVGGDQGGDGARMIRVLDWGLAGLGRHVVISRQETPHGPFYNATWPGYAGVLTAMAPGRFSAAINQAPRVPVSGIRIVDQIVTRLRVLRANDTVLASHLLRRIFESAADFEGALAMLADERITLAMPALFVLAGIEPHQGCIIEALGGERRVHRMDRDASGVLGIANQWLSPDLRGHARNESATSTAPMTAEGNNRARQASVRALQQGEFGGAADLTEPVLNSHTVMVVVANARRGEMMVEALDPSRESIIPQVVARRSIRHLAA